MIEGKKVLVMILARSGSTGVKDKNIQDLGGKPVLWYSCSEALKSKYADAVCMSSDSPKYAKIAEEAGVKVPFLRDPAVSLKSSTAAESSAWSTRKYEEYSGVKYDYIVDFMCSNPFKTVEDLDACIEKLHKTGADTVVAVNRVWDGHPRRIKIIENDEIQDWPGADEILESLRQDLTPPVYIRCGSVYAMRRHVLLEEGNRRGKVSRPWIMPPERVCNIDEPRDLITARAMMELRNKNAVEGAGLGYKILAITRIEDLPEVRATLARAGEVDCRPETKQPELRELIHGYDAIMVPTHLAFDAAVLKKTPGSRLKVLCTPTVGTEHVDLEAAKAQGIEVIALTGRSELLKDVPSPAELAFALMLSLARRLPEAAAQAAGGRFSPGALAGVELRGRTVGIVGMGSVGTIFSEFCRAFRMNIIAYDPYKAVHQTDIVQHESLSRLLQESDFVSVHASLNDTTRGLIGAKQLAEMKKTAYLINTSRGPIVDGAALVEALKAGALAGAALDVIEGEIEAAASPKELQARASLLAHAKAHANLILTPHIGGTTGEARRKRAVFAAQKLYERLLLAKKSEAAAKR